MMERGLSRGRGAGVWIAALALVGVGIHSFLDGAALAAPEAAHAAEEALHAAEGVEPDGEGHVEDLLALGVLLHRLPVGFLMGLQLLPLLGWARTLGVAALMTVGTVFGFWMGLGSLDGLPMRELGIFQGLIAGMLLHIIFQHAPPGMESAGKVRIGALGGLVGVVLLLWVGHEHPMVLHCAQEVTASRTFMVLALESAPALLLAFGVAGLMRVFIRSQVLEWLGRGSVVGQSVRGMAFGLPLPICSCGVLPVYETLVKGGVPAAAAVSFLVATPELGVDALLLSLPLLGGSMALARVVAALVAALVVGLVVSWVVNRGMRARTYPQAQGVLPAERAPLRARLREGLRYGFIELFDHAIPWILAGLMIASLMEPALHSDQLVAGLGGFDVPLMALAGIPAYVCASGATPFVAVLMHKGLSAGAAIAFLLTGPATNATTFGVLTRLHGRRVAVVFGVSMFAVATALGYLTNLVLPSPSEIALHDIASDEHHVIQWASAAVLAVLLLVSWFRRGPRGWVGDLSLHGRGERSTHSHRDHAHDHSHDHARDHGHEHAHGCAHNHA